MKKLNRIRFAAPALLALGVALPAAAQQQPPAPLPAQAVRFPAYSETQLPNGLRLLVVENHALPVANLDLYVRSGYASDPQDRLGLAQMTAALLDKGTPPAPPCRSPRRWKAWAAASAHSPAPTTSP